MLKETGYQEKFELLKPWLIGIIELIRKDLRNEHLKNDKDFCRRYFLGKNFINISMDEMADAYYQEIASGNEGMGEFIASRWLLKNTDIYGLFESTLRNISEDFDHLEEIEESDALPLIKGAVSEFGATRTYLFSVLNSVVFPANLYTTLRTQAISETNKRKEEVEAQMISGSLETMHSRHKREIAALTDRYEKKLSGLQRKYLRDMDALKKQISHLQKKLSS